MGKMSTSSLWYLFKFILTTRRNYSFVDVEQDFAVRTSTMTYSTSFLHNLLSTCILPCVCLVFFFHRLKNSNKCIQVERIRRKPVQPAASTQCTEPTSNRWKGDSDYEQRLTLQNQSRFVRIHLDVDDDVYTEPKSRCIPLLLNIVVVS